MDAVTVMAFDYGLRHIGVAIGNSLIANAKPLAVVSAKNGVADWQAIEKLLQEWRPHCLVVGLPLNMDGTDSEMTLRARKFARQLHGRFAVECCLLDERLTSFEAKQNRRERGEDLDFGRQTVDAEAACIILQDYWRTKLLECGNGN